MIFSVNFNSTVPHANNALNLVYWEQFIYSITSKCKKNKFYISTKNKNELLVPFFTLNITWRNGNGYIVS